MASQFAGKDECIMVTSCVEAGYAIRTNTVAVCLQNGEIDEREVTLKPNLKCKRLQLIGHYDNHKLYIVEYSNTKSYEEDVNYMINWLSSVKDNMYAYMVSELLKVNKKIIINGDAYDNVRVYGIDNRYIRLKSGLSDRLFTISLKSGEEKACDTVDKCRNAINYLFNSDIEDNVLSDRLIHNLNLTSGIEKIANTYDECIQTLLDKYTNFAYNLEETVIFSDYENKDNLYLYVHCKSKDGNTYYISVDKWEKKGKVKLAISKTTFDLIEYEYPERIKREYIDTIIESEYPHCYYHELVIRLMLFSKIHQYKKLKLKFMKYNTEIFEDKIPHKLIMMVGEYKDGTHFDDLEGCAGYSCGARQLILMRCDCFNSVDYIENLSKDNLCTMLHEMGHAYVNAIHGTNWETDPAMMGDVLYGINKQKYPVQYKGRGKNLEMQLKWYIKKQG